MMVPRSLGVGVLESRDDWTNLQQVFFYDCEIGEVEGVKVL